jgi:PIN domain nuclease of toxin-antitoxin system
VKLLVDTHALIWAMFEPSRLSRRARLALEAPDNDLMLSAATAYEIEYKRDREPALGRMPGDLERALTTYGFVWLPVTAAHAGAAGRLTRHHGDPFDRILVAQALAEGASLVSADARMPAYGAEVIW